MSNAIVILMLTIIDNHAHELSARQQRMTLVQCNTEINAAKAAAQSFETVFGSCVPMPKGSK